MKNMKKFVGVLMLTAALLVSMVIPSFAGSITVTGGAEGAEYAAYQLLNATKGDEDIYAYTLNDKYTAVLQSVTGATTQADIVAYIAALENDAEAVRAFGDNVYAAIVAAGLEADYVSVDNVFADTGLGYYLVKETKLADESDTYSLVMLDTNGTEDFRIITKEDKPSVEKFVQEKNDTTGFVSDWVENADYDIGDAVPYKLEADVSDKYADYKSYYYSIVDTMVTGLTYNNDAKITIDGVDVTEQFTIEASDNGFTATANLKELTGVTITGTSKVVVEYTCTLNDSAVVGAEGNPNEVYIEYENNPNHVADGNPDTPDKPGDDTPENPDDDKPGKSEKDVAIVFTFEAIVNKVNDKGALAGAGFTLYKNVEGTWTEVKAIDASEATTFNFKGLDAGEYKLVETTVPDGYNKCEDVVFEVVASYDTDKEPAELTDLKVMKGEEELASFTVNVTAGTVTTDVLNVSGTELPSTGGIGIHYFIWIGGGIAVAALVLLVTILALKRRED